VTEAVHRGRLRRLLDEGATAFGTGCAIPHAFSLEQVARAGFDWVFIDMQHGLTTYATLPEMCLLLKTFGITPLVRVPFEDNSGAQRALDAGAEGVIFPCVEDAAAAQKAAVSCRYPPRGVRSFGPYRAPFGADIAAANEQVLCLPMIESALAVERLDEILSIPGVDGVFVGPNDMSISMGGGPVMASLYAVDGTGATGEGFDDALVKIREAAMRHGKYAGIAVASGDAAHLAAEDGFDFVAIGGDSSFLHDGARSELHKVADLRSDGGR
jgi:4-hydroxy-2-oxoheptanedioate aldolase